MPKFPTTPLRTALAAISLFLLAGCAVEAELPQLRLAEDEDAIDQQEDEVSPDWLIKRLEDNNPFANPLASEVGPSPEDAQALHEDTDLPAGTYSNNDNPDLPQAGTDTDNVEISPANEDDEEAEAAMPKGPEGAAEQACSEADYKGDVVADFVAPDQVKAGEVIPANQFKIELEKVSDGSFGKLKLALFITETETFDWTTAIKVTATQAAEEPATGSAVLVKAPEATIPASLSPGKYSFALRIDEGPEASECIRDNNTTFQSVEVL